VAIPERGTVSGHAWLGLQAEWLLWFLSHHTTSSRAMQSQQPSIRLEQAKVDLEFCSTRLRAISLNPMGSVGCLSAEGCPGHIAGEARTVSFTWARSGGGLKGESEEDMRRNVKI